MGKGKKTPKKGKKKISPLSNAISRLNEPLPVRESPKKKKNKLWPIIVGIGVIAGILVSIEPIRKYFLTSHQKYEEEYFKEGYLKPKKITDQLSDYIILETPPIYTHARNDSFPEIKGLLLRSTNKKELIFLMIGRTLYALRREHFYQGVQINIPSLDSLCGVSKIMFGIRDERLYISTEFKDLQKEETIGIIEYNHWKLYVPNMLDFRNDDNSLEVKDKQNNVVFSINYELKFNHRDAVYIGGYFINSSSVIVMPNDTLKTKENYFCFSKTEPNWKKNALVVIEDIKPTFH